jgi:hypothetical protein
MSRQRFNIQTLRYEPASAAVANNSSDIADGQDAIRYTQERDMKTILVAAASTNVCAATINTSFCTPDNYKSPPATVAGLQEIIRNTSFLLLFPLFRYKLRTTKIQP